MSRMLIASGLHLDRAYPDFPPAFGAALRLWSRQLLSDVLSEATRNRADTLLLVGNIVDRETTLPDTLEHLATSLAAFSGRVLIAPGPRDRAGDGPYERTTWGPNTTSFVDEPFRERPGFPGVHGSAWGPSGAQHPVLPGGSGRRRVLVRAEVPAAHWGEAGPFDLYVTSGEAFGAEGGLFVAPELVSVGTTRTPSVLALDTTDGAVSARLVPLAARNPIRSTELDISAIRTTTSLARALGSAARGSGPLWLRLVGTVAPGVLLPQTGGPELSSSVHLDLTGLRYAESQPDPRDHSMIGEFLRAMVSSPDEPRVRHQMTALGLRALATAPPDDEGADDEAATESPSSEEGVAAAETPAPQAPPSTSPATETPASAMEDPATEDPAPATKPKDRPKRTTPVITPPPPRDQTLFDTDLDDDVALGPDSSSTR